MMSTFSGSRSLFVPEKGEQYNKLIRARLFRTNLLSRGSAVALAERWIARQREKSNDTILLFAIVSALVDTGSKFNARAQALCSIISSSFLF